MALHVARQVLEELAAVVGAQPLLDRARGASAGAIDDDHPVGAVVAHEPLRQRPDGERDRKDQQRQPEAAHRRDLAELAGGDDQDVFHARASAGPTI